MNLGWQRDLVADRALWGVFESPQSSGHLSTVEQGFWSQDRFGDIRAGLGIPHMDPKERWDCLATLFDGKGVGRAGDWTAAAEAAVFLRSSEPLAAAMCHLYTFAGIHGFVDEYGRPCDRNRLGPTGAPYVIVDAVHPIWTKMATLLAESLLLIGAVFGAKSLADYCLDAMTLPAGPDDEFWSARAELRRIARSARKLLGETIREFAFSLHGNLPGGGRQLRAGLGTVYWLLGAVPSAHEIATGHYVPTVADLVVIVRRSMLDIPVDPLLQAAWLELRETSGCELRSRYGVLDGRVTRVYRANLALVGLGTGMFGLTTRVLRACLGDDDDELRALREEWDMMYAFTVDAFRQKDDATAMRMEAIRILSLSSSSNCNDAWRDLSTIGGRIARRQAREGWARWGNRALHLPVLYLESSSEEGRYVDLELLEGIREASRWYWRTVNRPATLDDMLTETERAQEDVLLKNVRGLRFVTLWPKLPFAYQRFQVEFGSTERHRDLLGTRGQDVAREALRQLQEELATLWEGLSDRAADYVERRQGGETLERFVASFRIASTGQGGW